MRVFRVFMCVFALVAVLERESAAESAAAQPVQRGIGADSQGPDCLGQVEVGATLREIEVALDVAVRRIGELETKVRAMSSEVGTASDNASSLAVQLGNLQERASQPDTVPSAPAFSLQPYGYVKVDFIYDGSKTSGTDAATFVRSQQRSSSSDGHFSATVRQSRLGVNAAGPDVLGGRQAAKAEIDFYAAAANETKAQPYLRQAYWQLSYPNWNLLVGQTGEVVSPMFPTAVNYACLAYSGNPGHRKPMIRYERTDKVIGNQTLQFDFAIVRGVGSSVKDSAELDDEGSSAGWPVLQSRVGITIPTPLGRPAILGLSGHLGQEAYDATVLSAGPPPSLMVIGARRQQYMTYSGNIDWKAPLADEWDFNGEFFAGRNLDAYMAGIGQGVNTGVTQGAATYSAALDKPIDSVGGWSQLCYKPVRLPAWKFSVGIGVDDPDNADLSGSINKSRNLIYFGNGIWNLSEKTQMGVELSYMITDYMRTPYSSVPGSDGESIRLQGMLQYSF